jgi:hypothetical protein
MATTARPHKARSQAQNEKKMPVAVIRPGNGVSLAIYESTVKTKDGRSRTAYSGTIRKSFRNSEGKWDHVQTLYPSDFLQASFAYEQAYKWVLEQYESDKDESDEDESDQDE